MQNSYQCKTPLLQKVDEEEKGSDTYQLLTKEYRIKIDTEKAPPLNESKTVRFEPTSAKTPADIFESLDTRANIFEDRPSRKTLNMDLKLRTFNFDAKEVRLNHAQRFRTNKIHTSKYTILNFLPKNLFYQF